MNPLLQSREWLIQPEALRSMALAVRAFNERGNPLPQSSQQSPLGVVQAVIDDSAALANEGIKVEVFSVGKYKAMGAPGTPLTDDQRDLIHANLAEIAGEFRAAVLAEGRSIPADAMEGQTFSGKQAQRFNLAGMVPDRAEAMEVLTLKKFAPLRVKSLAAAVMLAACCGMDEKVCERYPDLFPASKLAGLTAAASCTQSTVTLPLPHWPDRAADDKLGWGGVLS